MYSFELFIIVFLSVITKKSIEFSSGGFHLKFKFQVLPGRVLNVIPFSLLLSESVLNIVLNELL